MATALLGRDPLQRWVIREAVAEQLPGDLHIEGRQAVQTAVEMALLDLAGKVYQAPLYELLGGRYREAVPVSWVAYIRGTALLETEIEEKVQAGFQAFKLKVGEDFELDCDRVRALRQIAGPEAYLKVDASGAWAVDEAIENLHILAELGVDAVETPIGVVSRNIAKDQREQINQHPDHAAAALARVRAAVRVAVIEHVADFDDAFALALIAHRAVDIFNIVPCQAGSLLRVQRLAHLAAAGGLRVLLGSTIELAPGTAASLHLGVAMPSISVASDLVGPGLLTHDIVTPPLAYQQGQLIPNTQPGLGITLYQFPI